MTAPVRETALASFVWCSGCGTRHQLIAVSGACVEPNDLNGFVIDEVQAMLTGRCPTCIRRSRQ